MPGRAIAERAVATGDTTERHDCSVSPIAAQTRRRATIIAPLTLLAVLLILSAAAPAALTRYYTGFQDRPLLLAAALILGLSLVALPATARRLDLSTRAAVLVAVVLAIAAYAGHHWLLGGYDLTRDEQMATFDALIFASGHIVAPLPSAWQGAVEELNTLFMFLPSHPGAWVSGYLPMNAVLRTAAGLIGDPALAGAALTGLAAFLTWSIARQLWPEDREPAVVALAMLALSGQVLMTGMTAYAMPAHLALNLLWLRLFLMNRRAADVAALATGFVATGLHQPVFHPMFVAPWLLLLLADRDWRRLALFVAGYGAIGIFWLAWPHWIAALLVGPGSVPVAGSGDYVTRLKQLLAGNTGGVALMAANLLRFIAWQHVLLLPLVCAGVVVARHDRRAAALAGGMALTVLAMLVLLPYQGHGFGYRYLHGLIGSAALLAGLGWCSLVRSDERLRPLLARTSVATLLVMLPLQATIAHRFYAPYAAADARIATTDADYVVIGGHDAPFSGDLIINRPTLSNRPLRLLGDLIRAPEALAQRICRSGVTVAMPRDPFFTDIDALFGTTASGEANKRRGTLGPVLEAAGCRIAPL